MKTFRLKEILPTEDDEAQCLIRWAMSQRFNGWKISDLLIMVPNGAYLGGDVRQRAITMAKLKRTGFRNGVSDYLMPVAVGGFHGLAIELKRQKLGVVSDEQKQFGQLLTDLGWIWVSCKGWKAAKNVINNYLHGASNEG